MILAWSPSRHDPRLQLRRGFISTYCPHSMPSDDFYPLFFFFLFLSPPPMTLGSPRIRLLRISNRKLDR